MQGDIQSTAQAIGHALAPRDGPVHRRPSDSEPKRDLESHLASTNFVASRVTTDNSNKRERINLKLIENRCYSADCTPAELQGETLGPSSERTIMVEVLSAGREVVGGNVILETGVAILFPQVLRGSLRPSLQRAHH